MFKIGIDITKTKKSGNVLTIEGIASSPVIDLDGESFSPEAIEKMKACVLKGGIPIKVEHEHKFYSDIGIWKEANITADGKLYVKGEIDLELSLARDLEVLLKKGMKIQMSVGGKVNDASIEYSDDGRPRTMYTDVDLMEISIVKNPANPETTLSISKSFDTNKKEETEVAKTLTESAKSLIKNNNIQLMLKKERSEKEIIELIEKCYDYKELQKGERPQLDGNDLSDKEISKMSNAYKILQDKVITINNSTMIKSSKPTEQVVEKKEAQVTAEATTTTETAPATETPTTTETPVTAEATETAPAPIEVAKETTAPATTEAPAEVVVETVVQNSGVGITEKSSTDGVEDVATATEDTGSDASLNSTGSETAEASTETPEIAPAVESETITPAIDEVAILEKAKELIALGIQEAIAPLVAKLEEVSKSINEKDTLEKSRGEVATKNFDILANAVDVLQKQMSSFNVSGAMRKSTAVLIEKKETESLDLTNPDNVSKAIADEMKRNGNDFVKARSTILSKR